MKPQPRLRIAAAKPVRSPITPPPSARMWSPRSTSCGQQPVDQSARARPSSSPLRPAAAPASAARCPASRGLAPRSLRQCCCDIRVGDDRHARLRSSGAALRRQHRPAGRADAHFVGAAGQFDGITAIGRSPPECASTVSLCGPLPLMTWIGAWDRAARARSSSAGEDLARVAAAQQRAGVLAADALDQRVDIAVEPHGDRLVRGSARGFRHCRRRRRRSR